MTTKAERIAQKEAYAKRQAQIAKQHGCKVKSTKHATTSAVTCGNPDCVMCGNPRKMWNEKTIQEKRFEQDLE